MGGSLRRHAHDHPNPGGAEETNHQVQRVNRARETGRRDEDDYNAAYRGTDEVAGHDPQQIGHRHIFPPTPVQARHAEYDDFHDDPDRQRVSQMAQVLVRQAEVEPQQKRRNTRERKNPELHRPHYQPVHSGESLHELPHLVHDLILLAPVSVAGLRHPLRLHCGRFPKLVQLVHTGRCSYRVHNVQLIHR